MTLDFIFSNLSKQFKSIKLTGWTIWALEKIYGSASLDSKLLHLRTLQNGTVGREIAKILDSKNYRLIPKFENHDLKHIILDYEMTIRDEIRMQAYLVGNGNYTLPCLIFLSLALFYPDIWKDLPTEFKQGKKSKSIHFLALDNCMDKSLSEVKKVYGRKTKLPPTLGFMQVGNDRQTSANCKSKLSFCRRITISFYLISSTYFQSTTVISRRNTYSQPV